MTQMKANSPQEWVSAFMDGEASTKQNLKNIVQSSAACEAWATYHLIGDGLRSPDMVLTHTSENFMTRFQEKFDVEPVYLPVTSSNQASIQPKKSLNSVVSLWLPRIAAGVATLAIGTAAWFAPFFEGHQTMIHTMLNDASADPKSVEMASTVTVVEAGVIRDPRLDEYLNLHGQYALRQSVPYLRQAADLRKE
jgi:sigma-E factor negative regulatory protein RseA